MEQKKALQPEERVAAEASGWRSRQTKKRVGDRATGDGENGLIISEKGRRGSGVWRRGWEGQKKESSRTVKRSVHCRESDWLTKKKERGPP